ERNRRARAADLLEAFLHGVDLQRAAHPLGIGGRTDGHAADEVVLAAFGGLEGEDVELRHALVRDHGAVALVAHRHRYGHEAPLALPGEVLVLEEGRDAQERGAEPADEFGLGPLPAVAPALAADGLVTPFEQAHEPARQAVLGPGVVHAAPDVEIAAALELLQPAPGEAEGEPGAAARVRAPLAQQVAAVAE